MPADNNLKVVKVTEDEQLSEETLYRGQFGSPIYSEAKI